MQYCVCQGKIHQLIISFLSHFRDEIQSEGYPGEKRIACQQISRQTLTNYHMHFMKFNSTGRGHMS